jgi:hypothetical protein
MAAGAEKIRFRSPSEIVFRLRERARCLAERKERDPEIEFLREPSGSITGYLPEVLFEFVSDKENVCRTWRELFPRSIENTLSRADWILENRIPVFSRLVDYSGRIDWHLEPVSGIRAPLEFYRDIDTLDPAVVGDVKQIWEINRHNFLISLGKAYWISGDRRYYEKWRDVIFSWIEDNPYNVGVNWESSIELAFRAVNWIWSGYFFRDELQKDEELLRSMAETLYLHGRHIYHHLSYYFSPNTHLTGEALGLLYIGKAFPFMKPSAEWVARAVDILERELFKQILDDGGYFEMATYYHKYTIDFYLHYFILHGSASGSRERIGERIEKMIAHLALISEPDGTIPLLGDSDGGRLLTLTVDNRDIRGACCAAAVLLKDGGLKHLCGSRFEEEAMWLLGMTGRRIFDDLEEAPRDHYHSIFEDTGLYCLRSGMSNEDAYVVIDCGPHGWKRCGHAHSDLLSFLWYDDGGMVLIDPGTFTYTGSKTIRDASRSSHSHNTITINGVSQSVPGDAFKWIKIAHPGDARIKLDGDFGLFMGEHDAYEELGCRHRRALVFMGKALGVVVDLIDVSSPLESLLYNLQLTEGDISRTDEHMFEFCRRIDGKRFYLRFFGTMDISIAAHEGRYYPDYGMEVVSPGLHLGERDIEKNHKIVTLLSRDRALIESFAFDGGNHLTGSSASGDYSIEIGVSGVEVKRNGKRLFEGDKGH